MRWLLPILVLLCFAIPGASLAYKTKVLKLPLLPLETKDSWSFRLEVTRNARAKSDSQAGSLLLPLPLPSPPGFRLTKYSWDAPKGAELVRRAYGKWLRIKQSANKGNGPLLQVEGELRKHAKSATATDAASLGEELGERTFLYYTDWKSLGGEDSQQAIEDIRALIEVPEQKPQNDRPWRSTRRGKTQKPSPSDEALLKFFYYVHEEITQNEEIHTFSEALTERRGSSYVRAKLFTLLVRHHGIPARMVAGAYVDNLNETISTAPLRFGADVWHKGRWMPVDIERGYFGKRDPSFWLIHEDILRAPELFEKKLVSFDIHIEPKLVSSAQGRRDYSQVLQESGLYRSISLIHLPLRQQSHFSLLLLLPLAALVLAFMRNVVGVPSFGIFTPVLLGIFFREVSYQAGMIIFAIVIASGFVTRSMLDKLRLLAIPRLSIILSIIVMGLGLFAVQNHRNEWVNANNLSLFPLVILTVFIERFSVTYDEEGFLNTMRDLLGTLVIAAGTYLVLKPEGLKLFLLTHPELTLAWVGALLMVGAYRGYRLSELRRFAQPRVKEPGSSKEPGGS